MKALRNLRTSFAFNLVTCIKSLSFVRRNAVCQVNESFVRTHAQQLPATAKTLLRCCKYRPITRPRWSVLCCGPCYALRIQTDSCGISSSCLLSDVCGPSIGPQDTDMTHSGNKLKLKIPMSRQLTLFNLTPQSNGLHSCSLQCLAQNSNAENRNKQATSDD